MVNNYDCYKCMEQQNRNGFRGRVTANNAVDVAPAESTYDAYTSAGIRATEQGAGTLKFVCKTVPTASISVNVKVYNQEVMK